MASNAKKISVSLGDWRMGSFDPQMDGVEKITHAPQEIPASKQEELQKKAGAVGVALVFVSENTETSDKEGE